MDKWLRKQTSFNGGWQFALGDMESGESVSLDDGNWRTLQVPHDWSIEHPVEESHATGGGGGYVKAGIGWYRKHFFFTEEMKDRKVSLLFDGVFMDSTVYLNGKQVGGCRYGYSSFTVAMTDALLPGENLLAVRVDNSLQPNSRWYTGSGIYRNVWLVLHGAVHMDTWGLFCHTNAVYPEQNLAMLQIRARIVNDGTTAVRTGVIHRIRDAEGIQISVSGAPLSLPPGTDGESMAAPVIRNPHLWSDQEPYLYTLESTVVVDDQPVDVVSTRFGIRSATFDCDRGFLLNGSPVKIKGMCVHHDCGLTGAVGYRETWERRLNALKEMGCNGIRCAHNPPTPELLDLCDELGFLVMDEAFDEWLLTKDKNRNYYSESFAYGSSMFFEQEAETTMCMMLRRDRNHPSVILWSIGNEIPEQAAEDGVKWLRFLKSICRQEDPGRMVTSACDNIVAVPPITTRRAFEEELDVVSYNYTGRWRERAETLYEEDRNLYPGRRFCGSENPSVGGMRGIYVLPEGMPAWFRRWNYVNATLENEWLWRYTASRDFVAGDYLWTGIDYLGESNWPSRGAGSGPLDTAGFRKDGFYYFRSIWNARDITLHLLPHWNWAGEEGQFKQVVAYTNCDEVELFLNGRSVGKKALAWPNYGCTSAWNDPRKQRTTHDLHLVWDVPFEPGELRAVGYRDEVQVEECIVRTTGEPATLIAVADRQRVPVDGVVHFELSTLDANGWLVPDAVPMISCEVAGPARLLGMDSGDLRDHTLYGNPERRMFSGCLLVMIQAQGSGEIAVTFAADGMAPVRVGLVVE